MLAKVKHLHWSHRLSKVDKFNFFLLKDQLLLCDCLLHRRSYKLQLWMIIDTCKCPCGSVNSVGGKRQI